MYQTQVLAGSSAVYLGETPKRQDVSNPDDFELDKWKPDYTNVESDLTCQPVFSHAYLTETIKDSWEEIMESIKDGSYMTKYKTGDTKELDLGPLGYVNMQIAGMHLDDTTNPDEVAAITWISEQVLPTKVTSALSPWENSEIRTYLYDTVYPQIPQVIADNIVTVVKSSEGIEYEEALWLPSCAEANSKTGLYCSVELKGKKVLKGNVATTWFLRDGYFNGNNSPVISSNLTTEYSRHTVLCFCTGRAPKFIN
jgi:hypothetical protein